MKANAKTCSGIVIDHKYQNHLTGRHHPEKPSRIIAIEEALKDANLLKKSNFINPKYATTDELAYCHTPEYIKFVQEQIAYCANREILDGSYTLITGDVQLSPQSYDIATLAVGGVLNAIDAVFEERYRSAFCIVRPPGHHACSNRGMGFCLFNNVAIGVRYAMKKHGVRKALIVDWDVHHGNGTQEIFHKDPSVFYFSTHQWPLYPGTGAAEENGVGNILNCPISAGNRSRTDVLNAFQNDLVEAMKIFQPEIVFISAGFDAHYMDPLGGMNLTEADFGELTRIVKKIANAYSKDRIISVLEGGYDLNGLALSTVKHFEVLNSSD